MELSPDFLKIAAVGYVGFQVVKYVAANALRNIGNKASKKNPKNRGEISDFITRTNNFLILPTPIDVIAASYLVGSKAYRQIRRSIQ